jgi:hypothetical protein
MLVNNPENNIDVFPVPNNKWFSKPDMKQYSVVNIENKGMISSCCIKNKILVGCKDGMIFEIEAESFKVTKSYQA